MTVGPMRPRLSAGEMRLMALLWDSGAMTLAEVYAAQGRDVGQTTIQTQLNRLVAKRVVARSKERPAKFLAIVERQQVSAGFLDLLIETVGRGKIAPLVAQLVSRGTLSDEDVVELRQLIDDAGIKAKKPRRKRENRA